MIIRLSVRLVLLGATVLLLSVAAVQYRSDANLQAYGGGKHLDAPVDAILVLGGGVDGDGIIGYSTRRRVRVAVELLNSGMTDVIIVSGGLLRTGVTAGDLMREFAISVGADPSRLVIESRAKSTFENLRFSFRLVEQRGWQRLAVVTDAYHLERARWLAVYLGRGDVELIAAGGLHRDTEANRVWSIVREAMAWWYNLLKVAAWEALGAIGMEPAERAAIIR